MIGYFDTFSGAAGDMIVGSALDCGACEKKIRNALKKLKLDNVEINIERVVKTGIAAVQFDPVISKPIGKSGHDNKSNKHMHTHFHHHDHHPHRHLSTIVKIIEDAKLSPFVTEKSIETFTRLAKCEAKIHGTTIEKIHFHEVGAEDAICDIVGAMVALESLGITEFYCSYLTVGGGTVKCAHGIMPVPAPATAELIKGISINPTDIQSELLTPTGAAILTTLCKRFGAMPQMAITATGFGAGKKTFDHQPNVLRLMVGESSEATTADDTIVVIEANIDDATGEIIGYVKEQLLNGGALDVYTTPIQMKKNRPGTMISVISALKDNTQLEDILLTESTTFGIRRVTCSRKILSRHHKTVRCKFGEVRIKIGTHLGKTLSSHPEYEDCKTLAQKTGVPLKEIMACAMDTYRKKTS